MLTRRSLWNVHEHISGKASGNNRQMWHAGGLTPDGGLPEWVTRRLDAGADIQRQQGDLLSCFISDMLIDHGHGLLCFCPLVLYLAPVLQTFTWRDALDYLS